LSRNEFTGMKFEHRTKVRDRAGLVDYFPKKLEAHNNRQPIAANINGFGTSFA